MLPWPSRNFCPVLKVSDTGAREHNICSNCFACLHPCYTEMAYPFCQVVLCFDGELFMLHYLGAPNAVLLNGVVSELGQLSGSSAMACASHCGVPFSVSLCRVALDDTGDVNRDPGGSRRLGSSCGTVCNETGRVADILPVYGTARSEVLV